MSSDAGCVHQFRYELNDHLSAGGIVGRIADIALFSLASRLEEPYGGGNTRTRGVTEDVVPSPYGWTGGNTCPEQPEFMLHIIDTF